MQTYFARILQDSFKIMKIVHLEYRKEFTVSRFSKTNQDFSVGAFRRKTQTIVVTFLFFFLKTNEATDFISFISWLPLTA